MVGAYLSNDHFHTEIAGVHLSNDHFYTEMPGEHLSIDHFYQEMAGVRLSDGLFYAEMVGGYFSLEHFCGLTAISGMARLVLVLGDNGYSLGKFYHG